MIQRVKSTICVITTVVIMCTFFVATAFAMTFSFVPQSTIYTTSTGTYYSKEQVYGHESQEAGCTLSFSVVVPKNTMAGLLTVRAVLQKQSSTGAWLPVRTIDVEVDLNNTSSQELKYVKGEDSKFADLTKGANYRVQYKILEYTGNTKLSLNNLSYDLNFVVG